MRKFFSFRCVLLVGLLNGLLFIIGAKNPVPSKKDIFAKKCKMFVYSDKVKHHNSGN